MLSLVLKGIKLLRSIARRVGELLLRGDRNPAFLQVRKIRILGFADYNVFSYLKSEFLVIPRGIFFKPENQFFGISFLYIKSFVNDAYFIFCDLILDILSLINDVFVRVVLLE